MLVLQNHFICVPAVGTFKLSLLKKTTTLQTIFFHFLKMQLYKDKNFRAGKQFKLYEFRDASTAIFWTDS